MEKELNKNLELWDKVCKTNPKHTKKVENQTYNFSVGSYHQIQKATELFGPFGYKWGVRNEDFQIVRDEFKNYCLYSAILFYSGNSTIPIHSDIEIVSSYGKRKDRYEQGWTKKVATAALSKGLSKLGFNADVFQGKFENPRYVFEMDCYFDNVLPEQKMIDPKMVEELIDTISNIDGLEHTKVLRSLNKHFNINIKQFDDMFIYQYNWLKGKLLEFT